MKKICFILAVILCFGVAKTEVSSISISAQYACVMDATTGRVIFEKNSKSNHSMASTTKIMTALLALENSKMDDLVTVSENAAGTEGSSIYLKPKDKVSMNDLLYGLMLQSGNDAAIAIAEHVSGSVESFANLMTKRAKEIGAKNTCFKNPNGLDEDGHFTTAYDLALITREALKNETFAEIVSTKSRKILDGTQTVTNHNKLLSQYEGCIGVKTGFTKKTGRCLVSAAERDRKKVIVVTLNAPNDWSDHKILLDYAFLNTVHYPLLAKDMIVNSVTVKNGSSYSLELCADRDFYITESPDAKFKNIKLSCKIPDYVIAPINKGEVIGTMDIYYNNDLLETVNLISATDISYAEPERNSLFIKYFKIFLVSSCT